MRSAHGSAEYSYDANGNLTSGNDRSISWSSYNKPITLSKGSSSVQFKYNPDRSRYLKDADGVRTLYFDKIYEKIIDNTGNGTIEHKQMIYADGDLVATHSVKELNPDTQTRLKKGATERSNTRSSTLPWWMISTETLYMHRDALGSIDTVTDGAGKVVDRMGYDAFGQRRYGSGLPANYTLLNPSPVTDLFADKTNRGFTGHEHIDEIGLIHMNGRVYDPELGRFLSADPFVQAPYNSQSFNRYSYVMNNPLAYTDPSGFIGDPTDFDGWEGPANGNGNRINDLGDGQEGNGIGALNTDVNGHPDGGYLDGVDNAIETFENAQRLNIYNPTRGWLSFKIVTKGIHQYMVTEPNIAGVPNPRAVMVALIAKAKDVGKLAEKGAAKAKDLAESLSTKTKKAVNKFLGNPYPTKKGVMGKPQAYDPKTGKFLGKNANPGLLNSPAKEFGAGFTHGMAEGLSSGTTGISPVGAVGELGHVLGTITGTIAGLFM